MRKFSLHTQISTLFILLIVVFGSTLAYINTQNIADLVLERTSEDIQSVATELTLEFQKKYRPIETVIRVLSRDKLADNESLQDRMSYLPVIADVLATQPENSAFQVGYRNGDYVVFRRNDSARISEEFGALPSTYYIVDHVSKVEDGRRFNLRMLVNESFLIEKVVDLGFTDFDVKSRPWFQAAITSETTAITKPYIFYYQQRPGVTVAHQSLYGGNVVAVDVLLDNVHDYLTAHRLTIQSELMIFDDQGQVLALTSEENTDEMWSSEQLTTSIPKAFSPLLERPEDYQTITELQSNGEVWFGQVTRIKLKHGVSFNLAIVAPKSELLQEANESQWNNILITLIVIVISFPVISFVANRISFPIRRIDTEARRIQNFDFENVTRRDSRIAEIDSLDASINAMKSTISKFLVLIGNIAAEGDFDKLLDVVAEEFLDVSAADGCVIFLTEEDSDKLTPRSVRLKSGEVMDIDRIAKNKGPDNLVEMLREVDESQFGISVTTSPYLRNADYLLTAMNADRVDINSITLRDRDGETIGLLMLCYDADKNNADYCSEETLSFSRTLSSFAAVAIENQNLLNQQKRLLESFIALIAGAIDAKSPYTGSHCQRVPELTMMLAKAAENSDIFPDFALDHEKWEELRIASWLHDCGKVTTPDFVVDKSTKLETIYDRIHEVRMRFEVLKRDAQVTFWQSLYKHDWDDATIETKQAELQKHLRQLDEEFAFVAHCNVGAESMPKGAIERLQKIAERTWSRTLDDRLGLSWEDLQRRNRFEVKPLPVTESLLADKPEHVIERQAADQILDDNPYGFKLNVPEHLYNRGELYNLSIKYGTLTAEERYKINDHIVQTIVMLDQLPFPKYLQNVPTIAGGHHERMDGQGYPCGLSRDDMPLTARMMAIADIFEALTASDRPYKKAKTLSESLHIMAKMCKGQHIDPSVFELFIRKGIYKEYATRFLQPNQIDKIDEAAILAGIS